MASGEDRIDRMAKVVKRLSLKRQKLVLALVEELAADQGVAADASIEPLTAHIDTWVTKLKSEMRSEGTIRLYRYRLEQALGDIPEPSSLSIQQYLAKRLERGESRASVENRRKAMASFFRFLHEEGLIPDNPMAKVRAIRVPILEKRLPNPEDVHRVLDVGYLRARDASKMRMIVILLMTAGFRLGEAISLRRENVNLDRQELAVVGKGNKRRVVPLVKPTVDSLREYMAANPSDSPFVFPGNTRHGHAEIHNIEKTLRRACIRAGVAPFTPHQLRHLFATEMLKNGAKLEVVSKILGHSSIKVTVDVYRSIGTGEMHEEIEKHGLVARKRRIDT
jgi:site-specific recombinase XerD